MITNPPFIAYFSTPPGILLVSANKCASTFLDGLLIKRKGFKKLSVTDDSSNELLNDPSLYKKIFIYRDPIDRFIGWYNLYAYTPFIEDAAEYPLTYKQLHSEAYKHISYRRNMIENIHYFLSLYSENDLKELLKWDTHTVPLSTYFEYTNCSMDDYHILDMYNLSQFTQDRFGESSQSYSSKNIQLTTSNIVLLNRIRDIIYPLYQQDYDVLYPKVKPYY